MLHGAQNTFKKGRSGGGCHVITNLLIKKQREFNLSTLIAFLDYKKAFNEVIRNNLWHIWLTNDFHNTGTKFVSNSRHENCSAKEKN